MTERRHDLSIGSVHARTIKGPVTVHVTHVGQDSPDGVIWNIPAAARTFSGRDDDLARVSSSLETDGSRRAVALCGLSGVGKTQLAFAYADRTRPAMRIGWLVPSSTRLSATAALAELAHRLGVEDNDQEAAARQAVVELRGREHWLLLFDNADNPADIVDLIPDGAGQVLITSLEPDWNPVAHSELVEPLTVPRAVEFLLSRSRDDDEHAAAELATRLGGLPLALEQAAAYCNQCSIRLAEYGRFFDSRRDELLRRGAPADYRLPVTVTFRMSFHQAARRSTAAIQLLKAFAFLDTVVNPREVVADVRGVPRGLRDAARDPLKLNEIVNVLVSMSLLTQVDGDVEALRIHPLVQTILRDQVADMSRSRFRRLRPRRGDVTTPWSTRRWLWCAANLLQGREWPKTPDRAAHLFRHVEALFKHADQAPPLPGFVMLSWWAADHLALRWELEAALEWQRRALRMGRRIFPPSRLWELYMNFAHLLSVQGRFKEARSAEEDILDYLERQGCGTMKQVLMAKNNLANTLHHIGEFAAARALHEEVLATQTNLLGEAHHHTVMSMNNLALTLTALSEHDEAEQLVDQAISRRTEMYGEADVETWATVANKALILRNRGDLRQAEALQQDVLTWTRGAMGDEHPLTHKAMNNLAVILLRQGRETEAEDLLQQALAGRRQTLGTRHPDTQDTAAHLAEIHASRK